jgi:carbamoyltransferase
VNVKEDKQEILGAVTHVDGTARIQTVPRKTNERYWQLIDEFRKITGIPIILNTSFNNNAEPIVDSVNDAIVCFLTTKLNYLVIGDYLIHKNEIDDSCYLSMAPAMPVHNVLIQTNRFISLEEAKKTYEIKNNFDNGYNSDISSAAFNLLNESDGNKTLGQLMEENGFKGNEKMEAMIGEIIQLWKRRFIILNPKGIKR